MGQTIAQKIIAAHLVDGKMEPGCEVGLRIDQTLTQDATGTMAYLEYEAMGIPRVRTELSVAYIDHNTLQSGFMNADDHRFIRTIAKKIGVRYSRPGNGICHQVHLERFAKPGKTLIGSDSHTPTAGGIGSLAMGAGGLDVAVAMGGGAYYIPYPKATLVKLSGALRPMVSAKDVILEVLRVMSVKGGVGKIVEYGGEGVKNLTVPQRATITNMGAELGLWPMPMQGPQALSRMRAPASSRAVSAPFALSIASTWRLPGAMARLTSGDTVLPFRISATVIRSA